MSSTFSVAGSFLRSRTAENIFQTGGSLLNIYNESQRNQEMYSSNELRAEQYSLASQQMQENTIETLHALTQQYFQQYENLSQKSRQIAGQTQAYYSSRGVELFGSAVQTLAHNMLIMQRMKDNLYTDYLRRYNLIQKEAGNRMLQYSLLKGAYQKRADSISRLSGWDELSNSLKLMQRW